MWLTRAAKRKRDASRDGGTATSQCSVSPGAAETRDLGESDDDLTDDDLMDAAEGGARSNELKLASRPGDWPLSRARRNFHTVGLNVLDARPGLVDPLLAIVLDYCGPPTNFVVVCTPYPEPGCAPVEVCLLGPFRTKARAFLALLRSCDSPLNKEGKRVDMLFDLPESVGNRDSAYFSIQRHIRVMMAGKSHHDRSRIFAKLPHDDQANLLDALTDEFWTHYSIKEISSCI